MNEVTIKRALVSVSNKENIVELCTHLRDQQVEIISTGGTGKLLKKNGIDFTPIENVTGNPEVFNGRMKTLSFEISSALLYKRDDEFDVKQAKDLNISSIDLVVCNLYPFTDIARTSDSIKELVEYIDIGGPTMLRAAAKNHESVTVLSSPDQYQSIISKNTIKTTLEQRLALAIKAFEYTASYETAIFTKLSSLNTSNDTNQTKLKQSSVNNKELKSILIDSDLARPLRYGENSHQWAKVIPLSSNPNTLARVTPVQGRALSYNNYLDIDAAIRCNSDLHHTFENKACVSIIKHSNPCGASISSSLIHSLEQSWASDPISSFGSIIAFNKEVDSSCANFLQEKFIEVLIAPDFSHEALSILKSKKNLRLIKLNPLTRDELHNEILIKSIHGGVLMQNEDVKSDLEFQCMSNKSETHDLDSFKFSSIISKHLKSNAISLVIKEDDCLKIAGVGMGNPNRLISTMQAIEKAKENEYQLSKCILSSDAFFPFRDNIDLAASEGINCIIQPGGSIKDNEVIDAAKEHNISLYFTGTRHFRH